MLTFAYLFILFLQYNLPSKTYSGYLKNKQYHLNGFDSLIAFFIFLFSAGVPVTFVADNFMAFACESCCLGLIVSLYYFLFYQTSNRYSLVDFYLGVIQNDTVFGRIDIKMLLYVVGAVQLEWNIISLTAASSFSPAALTAMCLLTFFVFDYLTFERVHLYTYDIFAEKIGFKLVWGCLFFYPFFYAVPLIHPPSQSVTSTTLGVAVVIFFVGWAFARGANMQKYYFKLNTGKPPLRLLETTRSIEGKIIASGFWAVSRHVNYMGEILMGSGIAFSVDPFVEIRLPWLYPLYYILLLVSRQIDDDARCQRKYGKLWTLYCEQVPYKIVPFLY